ncbi:hypothetical protein H2200_005734 [Cladophialophora chaetospira]|uniref:Uncharacterized protein n=1 Tax=Cladophialophora chaetospira TaxID=386627 RepID=A0AA38X9L7_9EURO|nr:hypothetical protein H2200_005734 [Cladophialophora chaetospira]
MFITYTHVDEIKSRAKKWQVQSYQNLRRRALRPTLPTTDRSARERRPRMLPWKQASRLLAETSGSTSESSSEDQSVVFVVEDEDPFRTAIGSLRRDPFNSWPMENTGRVQLTVDYFTQVYAPMNAQNYRDSEGGNWLLSHLFKVALQADLLFESTVLFVWCQLPASRLGSSQEEHERMLMSVRGSVMKKLHHRLTVPKLSSDDVTIHTVLSLMAADFHRGQDDHVEVHREGLRRIVALRGGLEASDLPPQTRYSITATEMMCDYAIRRRGRSPKTNITPDKKLEYPTHPFPPALSKALSVLPPGFSDMALKTLLSYPVLKLLYQMTKIIEKGPAEFPKDTSIAVEMMRLSMESNATALEKAVVTLSFVFGRLLTDKTTKENRINSSTRTYRSMKEPLSALAKSIFGYEESAGQDFVAWAVFLLASVQEDHGLSRALQHATLARLLTSVPTVRKLEVFKGMLGRLFWHEGLIPQAETIWKRMIELKGSSSTKS